MLLPTAGVVDPSLLVVDVALEPGVVRVVRVLVVDVVVVVGLLVVVVVVVGLAVVELVDGGVRVVVVGEGVVG